MNTKNSIKDLGVRAKKAAGLLANISNDQKNKALNNLKKNLEYYTLEIRCDNKSILLDQKKLVNKHLYQDDLLAASSFAKKTI